MGYIESAAFALLLGAVCAYLPDRFSSWLAANPGGLSRLTLACALMVAVTIGSLVVNILSGLVMLGDDSFTPRSWPDMSDLQRLLRMYVPLGVGVIGTCLTCFVLLLLMYEHLLPCWRRAIIASKASAILIAHDEVRRAVAAGGDGLAWAEGYLLRIRELDKAIKAGRREPPSAIPDPGPIEGLRPFRDRLVNLDANGFPQLLQDEVGNLKRRLAEA